MKHFLLFTVGLFIIATTISYSQFSIVSTTPDDGETNVPLSTTVRVTFSGALDTLRQFDSKTAFISNLEGAITSRWYSADAKTVNFAVTLQANSSYFFVVYHSQGAGGEHLQTPVTVHFATGGTLGGHTVSGTIHGAPGISPGYALVALSLVPLSNGMRVNFRAVSTSIVWRQVDSFR